MRIVNSFFITILFILGITPRVLAATQEASEEPFIGSTSYYLMLVGILVVFVIILLISKKLHK